MMPLSRSRKSWRTVYRWKTSSGMNTPLRVRFKNATMHSLLLWKNGRAIPSSPRQIPIYLSSLDLMRNLLQILFCMSMISLRFPRLRMNIQPIRGHMWRPNGSIRYPCCSSCVFVWLYITHILGTFASARPSRYRMLQIGIAISVRLTSTRHSQGTMGPQTTPTNPLLQYCYSLEALPMVQSPPLCNWPQRGLQTTVSFSGYERSIDWGTYCPADINKPSYNCLCRMPVWLPAWSSLLYSSEWFSFESCCLGSSYTVSVNAVP